MGCDIHAFVEKRIHRDENERKDVWKWVSPSENPEASDFEKSWTMWDLGRNYDLFAILANVRNGVGFAGIKTGEGFRPILPKKAEHALSRRRGAYMVPEEHCRGVPSNCTPEYLKRVKDYGIDGHSHSWLTLDELFAFDWGAHASRRRGVLALAEYIAWKEKGKKGYPAYFSASVSGPGIEVLSEDELNAKVLKKEIVLPKLSSKSPSGFVESPKQKDGMRYYVRAEWEVTYGEAAGRHFVETFLPVLQKIAKKEKLKPEDIRFAFFFDN